MLTELERKVRRAAYPEGIRIRAVRFADSEIIDDNVTVPPGTIGIVKHMDSFGTLAVKWANGSTIGVLVNDKVEVV